MDVDKVDEAEAPAAAEEAMIDKERTEYHHKLH